jgi:hypothetical protein
MLLAFNANATTGVGEYRFGPDVAENLACEIAEDNARQDALIRYNGQFVEAVIEENCINENCKMNRQTYNQIEGYIKTISKTTKQVRLEQGYKVCVVTVNADIAKLNNNIKFMVDGGFDYKDGDEIRFKALVNVPGVVHLYNYHGGKYVRILQRKVATQNKEFMLPSEAYRMKAQVPYGQVQSKELLMFLFVNNDMDLKDSYTDTEMKYTIAQIPPGTRRVINRHINILR